MNPFSTSYENDTPDSILVSEILDGNKKSLTGLILRHQPFIYNIAWKMIGDPIKAEDLTQEALLKIISNLSSFKSQSSFRTWAYRIVRNHFLNDQKKPSNLKTPLFSFRILARLSIFSNLSTFDLLRDPKLRNSILENHLYRSVNEGFEESIKLELSEEECGYDRMTYEIKCLIPDSSSKDEALDNVRYKN